MAHYTVNINRIWMKMRYILYSIEIQIQIQI